VLPIEFTLPLAAYASMGGHMGNVVPLEQVLRNQPFRAETWRTPNPWPIKGAPHA
jgi:hypothetical protein